MARSRVKFRNGAIRKLMFDPSVVANLAARGEAVAAAANRDSSWGGYFSAVSTDGSRPREVLISSLDEIGDFESDEEEL